MAGIVPAIHVLRWPQTTWMPGTSPGMTTVGAGRPLLREPVRSALFDRALERRPRVHARQPSGQVRIWPDFVKHFCHLADKAHLDIGAGQRWADEELAALQCAVDIAEMVGEFAVDARMQRRARLLQPRYI